MKEIRKTIRSLIKEFYEGEEYYSPKLPENIKKHSHKFVGRQVTWYGDPEQMIVIHKSKVHGMWGNIYVPEKQEYLVNLINNSEENVEIECSYGIGGLTNLKDVVEEQSAFIEGRFDIDYDGKIEPSSSGDMDLDNYLGHESVGEFDDISMYIENYDLIELFDDNKLYIALGKVSLEDFMKEFHEISDGNNNDLQALKEFLKYEKLVKHAVKNQEGDIGEFTVQLRDGHHRVMSAIESGEDYVCLNLDKESIEKYKGHYKKV
jgi:hypothetical protein